VTKEVVGVFVRFFVRRFDKPLIRFIVPGLRARFFGYCLNFCLVQDFVGIRF
jgi:hypothetical protein